MKKNTIDLVAKDQRELVEQLPHFSISDENLESFRDSLITLMDSIKTTKTLFGKRFEIENVAFSEQHVYVYYPEGYQIGDKLPGIFYIHGGGYVAGNTEMYDEMHHKKATALNAIIVATEYRLAPEFPFPTPLMDCLDSFKWMLANQDSLHIEHDRISIMGESAGGGLAAALTLYVTDKNIFAPKNQFLIYPMLDCRTSTDKQVVENQYTGEFFWTDQMNAWSWDKYRGEEPIDEADFHYFSPSFAKKLEKLPPTYLMSGSVDLFFDEDIDYGWRIARAGIPLNLEIVSGGIHAFDALPGVTAERYNHNQIATLKQLI